jgi:hypothetical protein|eukprot:COSAG06_NODE_2733_length_6369_cov_4.490878_13_plen_66_part_00
MQELLPAEGSSGQRPVLASQRVRERTLDASRDDTEVINPDEDIHQAPSEHLRHESKLSQDEADVD